MGGAAGQERSGGDSKTVASSLAACGNEPNRSETPSSPIAWFAQSRSLPLRVLASFDMHLQCPLNIEFCDHLASAIVDGDDAISASAFSLVSIRPSATVGSCLDCSREIRFLM